MSTSLSCLQVVAGLHPRGGGPSQTVVQLSDALAESAGVEVSLLTQGYEGEPAVSSRWSTVVRHVCESRKPLPLWMGLGVRRELVRIASERPPSLIHNNGLWMPVNRWACVIARSQQIPVVIQPHGMLEPWALNYKAWKKRFAMAMFQRRDLESAALLVATSLQEYRSIRELGLRQPVAVIPNGVQVEAAFSNTMLTAGVRGTRSALFLSRVHPKKGLLNLVEAWGRLKPANWRLVIAGPDEGGHLPKVMDAARATGIADVVDYVGEVDGARKAEVYASADLFVLPTFSENFGVVVAEALAHGLPVVTTRGAPWSDLVTHRCGWWVDIGIEPLERALREAISLSDDERRKMGMRGRQYVQRYDWRAIALQMADAYRWVLGQRPQPECVHTG